MRFAKTPSNIFAVVMVLLIAMAPLRVALQRPSVNSVAYVVGQHRLTGTIVDSNAGEITSALTLANLEVDGVAKNNRALVRVPRYPASGLGDRVTVTCNLEQPEAFEGFAYDRYLAARDIYAICDSRDVPLLVATDVDATLRSDLLQLRQAMTSHIGHLLPEPQATLLSGLLFGVADFSDAWRERFAATGTSHIVAASGFNVAIVVLVLFHVLTSLGIRRQHALPLLIGGIVLYALLAGASPAVVRAAVMGTLVLMARHLGRKTTMCNVLLLTVAAILSINPLMLWDVGFQLSVVSTVALLWFAPHLAAKTPWIPETFGIREALVGSFAATLLTLPVTVVTFGQVSLVSPFVNMLVLPLVPFAMAFGVFAAVMGGVFGPIGSSVQLPVWTLLTVMLDVIAAFASLPFAAVMVVTPLRWVIAAFCTFFVVWLWRRCARSVVL